MSILDLAVKLGPKAVKFFAEHSPNSMKLCGINNAGLISTLEYLAKNNGKVSIKVGRKTGNRVITFAEPYTTSAQTTYVFDKMGNQLQKMTSRWEFQNNFNSSHFIERTNKGVIALQKPGDMPLFKYQTVVTKGKRYIDSRNIKMSNFLSTLGFPIVPDSDKGIFKEVSIKYSNSMPIATTKLKVMEKSSPIPKVIFSNTCSI